MGISAEEEHIEEERIWEECFRGDILDKFGCVLSLSLGKAPFVFFLIGSFKSAILITKFT